MNNKVGVGGFWAELKGGDVHKTTGYDPHENNRFSKNRQRNPSHIVLIESLQVMENEPSGE